MNALKLITRVCCLAVFVAFAWGREAERLERSSAAHSKPRGVSGRRGDVEARVGEPN